MKKVIALVPIFLLCFFSCRAQEDLEFNIYISVFNDFPQFYRFRKHDSTIVFPKEGLNNPHNDTISFGEKIDKYRMLTTIDSFESDTIMFHFIDSLFHIDNRQLNKLNSFFSVLKEKGYDVFDTLIIPENETKAICLHDYSKGLNKVLLGRIDLNDIPNDYNKIQKDYGCPYGGIIAFSRIAFNTKYTKGVFLLYKKFKNQYNEYIVFVELTNGKWQIDSEIMSKMLLEGLFNK